MCLCEQKGGTHSKVLNALALETWAWCLQHKITIRAQHVPGKLHVEPDYESRHSNDPSDWKLKPQFIQIYLSPDSVDLFAACLTKQTANFVSWRPDPEAYHADAFTLNWHNVKGPPRSLCTISIHFLKLFIFNKPNKKGCHA